MRIVAIFFAFTQLLFWNYPSGAQEISLAAPGLSRAANNYLILVQIEAWVEAEKTYPGGPKEMLFAPRFKQQLRTGDSSPSSNGDTLGVGKDYARGHFEGGTKSPSGTQPSEKGESAQDLQESLSQQDIDQVTGKLLQEVRKLQEGFSTFQMIAKLQKGSLPPEVIEPIRLLNKRQVHMWLACWTSDWFRYGCRNAPHLVT